MAVDLQSCLPSGLAVLMRVPLLWFWPKVLTCSRLKISQSYQKSLCGSTCVFERLLWEASILKSITPKQVWNPLGLLWTYLGVWGDQDTWKDQTWRGCRGKASFEVDSLVTQLILHLGERKCVMQLSDSQGTTSGTKYTAGVVSWHCVLGTCASYHSCFEFLILGVGSLGGN